MKTTVNKLKQFIRESMRDDLLKAYGIDSVDHAVSSAIVKHLIDKYGEEDFDHAMFVDDMEGFDLRDHIASGDEEAAIITIDEILQSFPFGGFDEHGKPLPGSYDPWANNYNGPEPKRNRFEMN